MKRLNVSALGVVIGCINVVGFSITAIYVIRVLSDFHSLTLDEKKGNIQLWGTTVALLYVVVVICLLAILISSLLIAGILKRRHALMRPWLFTAAAGIVCNTFRLIVGILSDFLTNGTLSTMFSIFFVGILVLSIQILIFYPIYKLYKDIRDERHEIENEEAGLTPNNENPPSYGDLERKGEI